MDNQKKSFTSNIRNLWILVGVLSVIIIIILIMIVDDKITRSKRIDYSQVMNNKPVEYIPQDIGNQSVVIVDEKALEGAQVVVEGANPISRDDVVLTKTGEVADNAASPASPDAPKQTAPLTTEQIKTVKENNEVIKIQIGGGKGWNPNSFTVNAGDPVTISIENLDSEAIHIFRFVDEVLAGIGVGALPATTRVITFNAPEKIGEYQFVCSVPGHEETGKMIVK
jgi:uncharacterized cupredoxin-like copper-binding protein